MTQIITKNLNSVLRYREKIFFGLIACVVIFAISYVYFVHSTIVNIVEREKILKDIRDKSTSVSVLETTYFAEDNKINLQLAHSMGYQDSEVSSYITKKPLTAFVVHNEL